MWHYVQGTESAGPVSAEDLRQLLLQKQLNRDTLIWRPGMDQWGRLEDAPELAEFLREMPPPVPRQSLANDDGLAGVLPVWPIETREDRTITSARDVEIAGSRYPAKPWQRFWARMLDIWLYLLPTAFGVGVFLAEFYPALYFELISVNDAAFGIMVLPFTMLLIGCTSTIFGTTVGRWLFGVRIVNLTLRSRLFFNLYREGAVWLKGLALGVPIFALFTEIHQYNRLKAGKPASYDDGSAFVEDAKAGIGRRTFGTLLILLLAGAQIYLAVYDRNSTAAGQRSVSWENPVTGKTTNVSGTWSQSPLDNPGNGELYYFASDENLAEALVGAEIAEPMPALAEYAVSLETALSDTFELGEWRMWAVEGQPSMKIGGHMKSDQAVNVEITVTIKGRRAWRTIMFTRGRKVQQVQPAEEFVKAMFRAF